MDGTVNVGQISVSGASKTILVGGLGSGGKGLYALDITDPTALTETEAASKILWEITPTGINYTVSGSYADLGYTYGTPVIAKINTGASAIITGNGYMNGGSGQAVLYVINPENGALIRALDTGSGSSASPNGLSSPAAIDTNGDDIIDRVYAGDIDGNLWKFDLSSASSSSWTSALLFVAGKAITGAPVVAAHPQGGYIVTFGTGRMLTSGDATDTAVHYVYGIWDGAPAGNITLVDQTLTEKTYSLNGSATRVRVATANTPNWAAGGDRGWRTALLAGERVIGDLSFIENGRFYITGTNPTITNPSPPHGENWLLELNYLSGGGRNTPFLDLNGDSLFNDLDRVMDGSNQAISGAAGVPMAQFINSGVLSQPILVHMRTTDLTLFNGNPDVTLTTPAPLTPEGRGVSSGHFDFDIYYRPPSQVFASKKHVHEYDDNYDVTGVNMLNASNTAFNLVNAIPSATTPFKILVANQSLNRAAMLSLGGAAHVNVKNYQTSAGLTLASLPTYTRASVGTLEVNLPLDAFAVKDWWGDGVSMVGLIPTQTGCVKKLNNHQLKLVG